MAPSREIEKLERRWQENPLGLTFAPLAEAYRKEGRFPDAIELLNIGLTQHPNYVPAHIVRGRCFLDTQADRAAEAAFKRVIEIDGENVIALKALADIAERAGRFDEARSRLERLLEFDRNNDEARDQLARVLAALRMPRPGEVDLSRPLPQPKAEEALPELLRQDAAPAAEPVVEPVHVVVPDVALTEISEAPPEPVVEPNTPTAQDFAGVFGAVAPPPEPARVGGQSDPSPAVQRDQSEDPVVSTDNLAAPAEVGPVSDPVAADPTDDRIEIEVTPELGAVGSAADPEEPEEPVEDDGPFAAVVDAGADALDVVAFNPVELSPVEATEYQLTDDAATLRPDEARGRGHLIEDVAPFDGPGPAPADEAPPAPDPIPVVAAEVPEVDTLEAPPPADEPLEVEPADVEEVLDPEPDAELVITESMAELFLNQGHRELALAVYTQLLTRDPDNPRLIGAIEALRPEEEPAPAPGLPAYAAVLTGGQSVRGYFEQLLSARRPRPGRPEPDVSLGSVFGDARGSGASFPDPDAGEAGPTFDEFFSADESGPPPAPPEAGGDDEDAGAEDLENFTTWLKGLKR